MPTSTQYTELIKRSDETNKAISDLIHMVEMFMQKNNGEHCNINTKLDEVRLEVYGNGNKQRLREMVTRLWDDAKSVKASKNAFYLAAVILIADTIINRVWK